MWNGICMCSVVYTVCLALDINTAYQYIGSLLIMDATICILYTSYVMITVKRKKHLEFCNIFNISLFFSTFFKILKGQVNKWAVPNAARFVIALFKSFFYVNINDWRTKCKHEYLELCSKYEQPWRDKYKYAKNTERKHTQQKHFDSNTLLHFSVCRLDLLFDFDEQIQYSIICVICRNV